MSHSGKSIEVQGLGVVMTAHFEPRSDTSPWYCPPSGSKESVSCTVADEVNMTVSRGTDYDPPCEIHLALLEGRPLPRAEPPFSSTSPVYRPSTEVAPVAPYSSTSPVENNSSQLVWGAGEHFASEGKEKRRNTKARVDERDWESDEEAPRPAKASRTHGYGYKVPK